MTNRSRSTDAARAGGRSLARVVALVLAALGASLPGRAQTWEMLPLLPDRSGQGYEALDFLIGPTPAQDSVVSVQGTGVFLYNPSGASGAAGDNGEWGAWHPLCTDALCPTHDGVVKASNAIVIGDRNTLIRRSTDRGRTWTTAHPTLSPDPMAELTLGAFLGPDGTPGLLAGVSDDGNTARSFGDGAPGTWERGGNAFSFHQSIGEVPPSPALPNGRILFGVWNGITYSDDKATTWRPSSAYGFARYIAWSFTWQPITGHPYGGTVYSGVHNVTLGEARGAELLKSEDGGLTWTLVHSFTAAEMNLPVPSGGDVTQVIVFATPDGALWAGVSVSSGLVQPRRGGIMRSNDGGATWVRADAGFRDASNRGYAVDQFALARDGRLYAATTRGAWRTVTSAVAAEAAPAAASEVGVSVRPNPASGRVEVVLSLGSAGMARVAVVDALGREVAVVLDGPVAAGERVAAVETGAWPAGVYVVRVTVRGVGGAQAATARLVVAR